MYFDLKILLLKHFLILTSYYAVIVLKLDENLDQWIIANEKVLMSSTRNDISVANRKNSKPQKKIFYKELFNYYSCNWKTSSNMILSN